MRNLAHSETNIFSGFLCWSSSEHNFWSGFCFRGSFNFLVFCNASWDICGWLLSFLDGPLSMFGFGLDSNDQRLWTVAFSHNSHDAREVTTCMWNFTEHEQHGAQRLFQQQQLSPGPIQCSLPRFTKSVFWVGSRIRSLPLLVFHLFCGNEFSWLLWPFSHT